MRDVSKSHVPRIKYLQFVCWGFENKTEQIVPLPTVSHRLAFAFVFRQPEASIARRDRGKPNMFKR